MLQHLFTANQVIPGPAGQQIRDGAVLFQDGTILAVGPREAVEDLASPTAERRNFAGGTILPGLINCHVHLVFDACGAPARAAAEATHAELADRADRLLRSGVTTVRDLGDRGGLAIQFRDQHFRGPRIVPSGPPITVPDGHCWFLGGAADGEPELRARVRQNAELGAEVIKVMASGGQITPNSPSLWESQFTAAELAAIVDEAKKAGLPVAAHAHGTDAISAAADAGVATIEHCTWLREGGGGYDLRDDVAAKIAERGIFACVAWPSDWRGFMNRLGSARAEQVVSRFEWMTEHGIRMIPGTDAGAGNSGFDDYAGALQLYEHLGFDRGHIIEMATTTSAEALGVGDTTGQLTPGLSADLLVTAGDPLADLTNLGRLELVTFKGRPAALQAR
ncbi:amidohydrolase [Amycolatopsis sp. NBRC 101858]|uniref:amidohydrolase family protein n=1 Tax=Amycolatopsis sp. NBRC 101858 TaxID=3032200 RepID=UPI00249FB045|nr:amidohydrolase family protein [Amycolatopsis sp. NBRC 101858]GLY38846.1 amidohydrolase [Amycolatopsis sp. NBRC 101858]